ncbi:MAG: hypothetical protein ACRDNW_05135 [Trebonia sp.]
MAAALSTPAWAVIYRDVMWHKVADGVYCIEDADGLPAALVMALDDGTPLKAAETWWQPVAGC